MLLVGHNSLLEENLFITTIHCDLAIEIHLSLLEGRRASNVQDCFSHVTNDYIKNDLQFIVVMISGMKTMTKRIPRHI